VTEVVNKQLVTTDKAERSELLGQAQEAIAKDLSTLPLLQGAQVMVAGTDVQGVEKTLDPSFKTRLGVMSK
jgi:peptide/nickel transport system substrate-binding protein